MSLWDSPTEHQTAAAGFFSVKSLNWSGSKVFSPSSLSPGPDPVKVPQSRDPLKTQTDHQNSNTTMCESFIHSFIPTQVSIQPFNEVVLQPLTHPPCPPPPPPPPLSPGSAMTSPAAWRTQPPSPPINLPLQSH